MTVIRCSKTIPLPKNAVIRKNTVAWTTKRGKKKTGRLNENGNVIIKLDTWQIQYRDENGKLRRETPGLKSEDAARFYLAKKEAEVQRIKAGILTRNELEQSVRRNVSIQTLIENFLNSLIAAGANQIHIKQTQQKLQYLTETLDIKFIRNITADSVEQWIVAERKYAKKSARTINSYTERLKCFCNWAVRTGYLEKPPLFALKKLNEEIDRRKQRRALTEDELQRLFTSAKTRKKDGKDDRELIYRLLAGTGLRSKELSLTTPSQFDFIRNRFTVEAARTKNKKPDILPLHPDIANRLKEYIGQRNIQPAERIFYYSIYSLLKSFKADLAAAGIEQKSPDGRSLDVHSLRKTFGTMLARAGVPLTTTQRLMRHSSPELTAKLYIDVDPLDLQQAVGKLPMLPSLPSDADNS
ncbi:MAG: site-specific integrase [Planctomycetaceae bacterium]|jgi:integrase|nr:site-specific integrase [Planctomycetaceae bacterium]